MGSINIGAYDDDGGQSTLENANRFVLVVRAGVMPQLITVDAGHLGFQVECKNAL